MRNDSLFQACKDMLAAYNTPDVIITNVLPAEVPRYRVINARTKMIRGLYSITVTPAIIHCEMAQGRVTHLFDYSFLNQVVTSTPQQVPSVALNLLQKHLVQAFTDLQNHMAICGSTGVGHAKS